MTASEQQVSQRYRFAAQPLQPGRANLRASTDPAAGDLIDETRENRAWAGWLGVPRYTFAAVFARGWDNWQSFRIFAPGFVLATEREKRAKAEVSVAGRLPT